MEEINKQMDLLQVQNSQMKIELQECQSKVASLEEELTHRSTQLSKFEDECLESKMKCRKAEEESSNCRSRVGSLEDEIARTKLRTIQVEREFSKSKEKITQLEERCDKLEAINDLLEKLKDDSTFKKFIISECRKEQAQAAKEENLPAEPRELELPQIEGEDSLKDAYVKCQKLVSERKILLCEEELINAMAHERKAALKTIIGRRLRTKVEDQIEEQHCGLRPRRSVQDHIFTVGPAWNMGGELEQNFEEVVTQKLQSFGEQADYATTTAMNEYIKICRKFFVDKTKAFYVKNLSGEGKILAITESTIMELDFKSRKVCRECKIDDIREIRLKDPDNIHFLVKRASNSWKSRCLDIWIYSFKKKQEILDAIYGN